MPFKINNIPDWTQAQLNTVVNGGAPPPLPANTVLNDIVLPSDWNALPTYFVPYTGATGDVDLGAYGLSADLLTSTALTSGSVLFAGTGGLLSQDNANLFWDDTNNTFGIGTTRSGAISTTNAKLKVKGTGTGANLLLEAVDSANTSRFSMTEAGNTGFNIQTPLSTFHLNGYTGSPVFRMTAFSDSLKSILIELSNEDMLIKAPSSYGNGTMAFWTNGTEKARFNATGSFGVGTGATVSAKAHVIATTEQSRVGYDASNYYSTTVSSIGGVTFNATGTGAAFTFSDDINASALLNLVTTTSTTGQIRFNNVRTIHAYGTNNLFIGGNSGNFTTTGTGQNVGLGGTTLAALTSGYENTALGFGAGGAVTSGRQNLFMAKNAGGSLTTGIRNTIIGSQAGQYLTTGSNNTIIGANAAQQSNFTTGSGNIVLGTDANFPTNANYSSTLIIGGAITGFDCGSVIRSYNGFGLTPNGEARISAAAINIPSEGGMTNGNDTDIVGSGTAYLTTYTVGEAVYVTGGPNGGTYTTIAAIASNTSLTLTAGDGYEDFDYSVTIYKIGSIYNGYYNGTKVFDVGYAGNIAVTAADISGLLQCNSFRIDQTPTAEVIVATHTITISANGTNYKIPCVAA